MKKIITYSLTLFLTVLFVFSGCNNDGNNKPASSAFESPKYKWGDISGKTITIWGGEGDLNRPYLQKAFSRYHELTGNTVEQIELSKTDVDTKVPAAFKEGSSDRPDILLGHGGTAIERLNPDENFYDFTNAEWVEDLTMTAINQTIYNSKVVGLPYGEASISGTLYNKDIFKKYGIEIPKTVDEFMEVCEKLLQNNITPVYLPYNDINMLLYQFPLDSILKNPETLNALNNGSLSYSEIPEMRKVIEWYKTMSDKGYFGSDYINNNWDGMNNSMTSGKYAMIICWDTWLYTNYDGDASKFGIMPLFMGVPDEGSFEGPNVIMLMVNNKSQNLDAALDLITFMSDPYNYNFAFEGIYTAPIFNEQVQSISTPQYAEAQRLIEKKYYDSIAWSRVEGFSQIDAQYIQKHMQDDSYTVDDCLRDMDAARIKRANE